MNNTRADTKNNEIDFHDVLLLQLFKLQARSEPLLDREVIGFLFADLFE